MTKALPNFAAAATKASALPRPTPIEDRPGAAFEALLKKHKLTSAEFQRVLQLLGRTPTLAELGIFSAMWSEHCSYKSSRVHLKRFPTTGPDVVVGPGENAGVVRLSGDLCLAFKMESHNHPSYIEPYQGAATGVGGILRDVFCMGARPVANLNALRFGRRAHPWTPHLVEHVVKGIGDYGNCVGIPTVGGSIAFDASYDGNCLVNAMTIGTIHAERIFKGYASGHGNLVVYVGSATGRDGIHGASMASGAFASADANSRSTVQVGDPFTEKLLLEATLEVLERRLVIGLQDMGAAGLTSSAFEMADRAGNGLYMDLDFVPTRTTAMSAYELLLSESQERMLMVTTQELWPELQAVLEKWQLHAAVIGVVTDTGRVQICHQGKLEVDVPVAPMTEAAPKYERPIQNRPELITEAAEAHEARVIEAIRSRGAFNLLMDLLKDSGSKEFIYRQYDHHIGTRTVHGPDHGGAAVLWMRSEWADPREPYLGMLATAVCNEKYCRIDPRAGAAHAVLKAARVIAAAGGRPLAITDCLNYGNPEDPVVMGDFAAGVDGISDACRELATPVVSGNVSLYNETDGKSIAPTPMIGMVGKMVDVRLSPPAVALAPGDLYLLCSPRARPRFGGSAVAKILEMDLHAGAIPAIDWQAEREAMAFLSANIASGRIAVARDVGDGGPVVTASKMVLARGFGLNLDLSAAALAHEAAAFSRYFGELAGAYLLMLTEGGRREALDAGRALVHNELVCVGQVTHGKELAFGGWTGSVQQTRAAFEAALS